MINDIRPQKNELREKAKAWRSGLHKGEKQRMDFKIQEKVLNLWKFRDVNTVMATKQSHGLWMNSKKIR